MTVENAINMLNVGMSEEDKAMAALRSANPMLPGETMEEYLQRMRDLMNEETREMQIERLKRQNERGSDETEET